MPGIQEIVNANRGVSVYNPVRPIRPRGLANGGTYRRVLGAEDDNPQQRSANMVDQHFSPQYQAPQSPLGADSGVLPSGYAPGALLARVTGNTPPPQPEQEGGGFLGTLVNSGPGRLVMGALEVLDTPRRVVTSGVQELVDAFNGGDASWGDFVNQVEDPTFGFGDIIGDTGNKWLNRFIGFTGDVLLDPLTYVMGAGLLSGAGRGARVSMGSAARAAGVFGDDVAQAIGRRGISILDDAQRAALREAGVAGVMDAGYYFRAPFTGRNFRIPGTGALERGVSGAASSVRASLAGTRGATALRRWRSPAGLEDAWRRILTGEGTMSFNEAAALVTYSDADRLARGTFISRLNAESQRVIREAAPGSIRSRGGVEALNNLIYKAETEGGTLVNDIFDSALEMMREVGINRPGRKNYVPHLMTDGAQSWLRGDSLEAKYLRETFFAGSKIDDISASMLERKLVPGNMPDKPFIINGKEFYIREGTIREMNDQFARLVPEAKFKFFEDDFSEIIARYSKSVADDVGHVAGARRLLNSRSNLVRRLGDEVDDATEAVINDIINKYADPEMAARMSDDLTAQRATVQTMREKTQAGIADLQGTLGVHAAQAIDELSVLEETTRTELTNLLQKEVELGALVGRTPDGAPAGPSPLQEALEREQAKIDSRMEKLNQQTMKAAEEASLARQAIAQAELQGTPLRGLALEHERVRRYADLQRERGRLLIAQETLASLHDQVEMQRRLAEIAQRGADNPSFINLSMGERKPKYPEWVDEEELAPGRVPEVKRRTKVYETEPRIRESFANRRQEVLRTADTRVQELEAAIAVQGGVVDRVKAKLDQTAESSAPILRRAEADQSRELIISDIMRQEIDDMAGDPLLHYERAALNDEMRRHEREVLGEIDSIVRRAREPVQSAKARVDFEERKLSELHVERNRAVQQSAEATDPLYSTRVQEQLLKLDRQEAEALKRLRTGDARYSFEVQVEKIQPNWGRERRLTENGYDGEFEFMDPRDRADLTEAHKIVRDSPRGTDAEQARVREARRRIKAIEDKYASALTPRQQQIRSAAQRALDDVDRKLDEIRELRRPMAFPKEGTPERAALDAKGTRGGDKTVKGRAQSALRLAAEELGDLPLDAPTEVLRRASLDHPLVAQQAVPGVIVHDLADKYGELRRVSEQYARAPMPHLRGRMEQLTRDTVRYVDFMGRYRLAIEAGMEPSDKLATFILNRQLKEESEAIEGMISGTLRDLENPRALQRRQNFELAAESYRNQIARLKTERSEIVATIKEVDAAIDSRGRTHALVRQRREAANRRNSIRRELRKAETNLNRLRPPALGVIGDDVDTMVFMLEDQLRSVMGAAQALEETKTNVNRMFRPPRERLSYLEARVPTVEKRRETMRIRADRQEAAISKAESAGKTEVGYWDYEPTATGREFVRMDIEEARALAAQNRNLQSAADSELRSVRGEIDVITGRARTRIDQIERLLLDQTTPPDVARMKREVAVMERVANPTPAQMKRLDFMRERIEILERENPLSAEEIGALTAQRDRLQMAEARYQRQIDSDEMYARSVLDDGQQFFENLLQGNRDITLKDMEILRGLFGGEGAEHVSTWVRTLNEAILNRETITLEELRSALDELAIVHGDASFGDWLFERSLAQDPDEMGAITIFTGDVRTAMIESAKAKRIEQTRELSSMLNLLGIAMGPTDSYGNMLLKMMGQKPYRKVGGISVDRGALRDFVVNQLRKTGWDPTQTYRNRLEDLKLAKARVDRMRRGLGSVVQSQRVKDPAGFYRWLYELDRVTKAQNAQGLVDDMANFAARLLPDDVDSLYQSRLAALQDDLRDAVMEGNSESIDELTKRINQLQDGARAEGVNVPEVPADVAEFVPPDAPTAAPPEVSEQMIARRQELQSQLDAADAAIERARRATAPEDVDDPIVRELRDAAEAMRAFHRSVDVENMTATQALELDDLTDKLLALQQRAKSAGHNPAEILAQRPAGQADSAVLDGLNTERQAIQDELDELDQEIEALGASGATEPLPEPLTDGLAAPDEMSPYDRTSDEIPDEELTLEQIDAEFEQVLSEYDRFQQGAALMRPQADSGTVYETGEALVARARRLRELRKQKMSELPPVKTNEYLTTVSNAVQAKPEVSYSWVSILRSGSPNMNTVRQLAMAETRAAKTIGSVMPTGVGMPLRDSLLTQEKALSIVEAERNRLRELARQTRGRARTTADEAKLARRHVRESEAAISDLEGQIPDIQLAKVNEIEQQRMAAIENKRRQAVLDREKAEQAYTAKLNEIDEELGRTRTIMEAARMDADRVIGARERIEDALSRPAPTNSEAAEVTINDLRDLAASLPDLPPAVASNVSAMLDSALEMQRKFGLAESTMEIAEDRLADFARQSDAVGAVLQRLTVDHMREIAPDLITGADSLYVAETMATHIANLRTALSNHSTWKLIGGYTAFFKTYATMRPGFHVRNAMSGLFMNAVDNVQVRHQWRALREYRKFKRDPVTYWAQATPEMRQAFTAVWGSGAGGQFGEYGLGGAGTVWGRGQHRLMNNFATRLNRRGGEFVEGTVRLGMAIDSISRGQSLESTLERITRYHFDYTQVSNMDRAAKQLIPFWTFMSRNLPLQVESMWLRPRTYQQYQSFVRNFAENADPETPEYWLAQGAFTMDENPEEGSPWYLAPDFPHLRVAEPLQALAQGDAGKALLADINPLILAPIEAAVTGADIYTGRRIEGYEEPTGPMTPLLPLLRLLGGTAVGGTSGDTLVDERYAHVTRSLLPPLDQLERYLDTSGTRAGRQDETILRAIGAPLYQLTPELRESTRRRREFDERDRLRAERELERL